MEDTKTQEIQKREARSVAEQTRPGRVFTPAVDILENAETITVLADLPGVSSEDLKVDLREGTLSIMATVGSKAGDGEEEVLREWDTGTFFRQFTISDRVDQSRIEAHLKDGVLRLVLPKAESARPRQINVKTS